MSKPETLRLADGTCKTCRYFESNGYNNFGYCSITLPVWIRISHDDVEVHEKASCDLYVAETKAEDTR